MNAGLGGDGGGGGDGGATNEIESEPLPIKPYAHPALGTSRVAKKSFFPVYITIVPPLPVAATPKSPLPTKGPIEKTAERKERMRRVRR